MNCAEVFGETWPVTDDGSAACVRCHRLTDFKSENLAEQMTLLDAQLFQKIEVITSLSI